MHRPILTFFLPLTIVLASACQPNTNSDNSGGRNGGSRGGAGAGAGGNGGPSGPSGLNSNRDVFGGGRNTNGNNNANQNSNRGTNSDTNRGTNTNNSGRTAPGAGGAQSQPGTPMNR